MTVFDNWRPDKPDYYIKQGEGWVQGTIVYTAGISTQAITYTPSTPPPPAGRGLPWEVVDFLLQHLGFTATAYPAYVTYCYRDDSRYTASYYSKARVTQWSDAQVREILAYASDIIRNYEASHATPSATVSPPEIPVNEHEVEEW